ncbi:MAG: PQQ-binding-like beta-propeller repeat protein [Halobacteriales archaeon]
MSSTRREFLAASVSTLALAAGCLGPDRALPERPTGAWRHRAGNARNTGASAVEVPPRGTPAWDEGEIHTAAPLVDGGTVFTVSGEATALDATDGSEEWAAELDGEVDHAPALTDDRLVVATDEATVALDRTDGTEVWSTSLPRPARGAVTVDGDAGLATVPLGERGVQALDLDSGARRWRDGTVGPNQAGIAAGTVYVTGYRDDGDTGVLRGLDAVGTRQWAVDLDHPDAPPVVADAGLVVSDAGTIAVHDPDDGTRRRELGDFGDRIDPPPAVADGTVYVPGDDGLAAVSLADGTVEWSIDAKVTVDTGVTVAREAVVAPVTDLPGVVAFERADGSRRWEHRIEGFDAAASTPAVPADGAVFYASNESIGVVALGDLPPETE